MYHVHRRHRTMLTIPRLIYEFISSPVKIPASSFEDIEKYTQWEGVYINTIIMDFYLMLSSIIDDGHLA